MNGTNDYTAAIQQAKANYLDLKERGSEAVGVDALAFMDSLLSPEERTESNFRVSLVGEMIKARQEKGISQEKLGELSGVNPPVIARLEQGSGTPSLREILKVLAPLGMTLAVVPLKQD